MSTLKRLKSLCVLGVVMYVGLLACMAPLHSAPSKEQYERIVNLVTEEKYIEATVMTETLLTVFPGDPQLVQILEALKAREVTPVAESKAESSSPSALSTEDRLELMTLVTGVQDAFKIDDKDQRAQRLVPLLARPLWPIAEDSDNPEWVGYWQSRALMALDLEDSRQGMIAGHHLRRLGSLESKDPAVQGLMIRMNQKNWLAPIYGRIEVISHPVGAELLAEDGQVFGTTPFVFSRLLEEQSGQFRVRYPGYVGQKVDYVPRVGEMIQINLELQPRQAPVYRYQDWVELARKHGLQAIGSDMGKAYIEASLLVLPARKGDYAQAFANLNTLSYDETANQSRRNLFQRVIMQIQCARGDVDAALATLTNLKSNEHIWLGGLWLGESLGEKGHSKAAEQAFKLSMRALDEIVDGNKDAQNPINRVVHYGQFAVAQARAGFTNAARRNYREAERYARRVPDEDSNVVYVWSQIGQYYAGGGMIDEAVSALQKMTTGSTLRPFMVYAGWYHAAGILLARDNHSGAVRILSEGRSAVSKAKSRFSVLNSDTEELLVLNWTYELQLLVKKGRLEEALTSFRKNRGNLRFNSELVDAILDGCLKTGNSKVARELIKNLPLSIGEPDAEDIRETEENLGKSRGKLIATVFKKEGAEQAEDLLHEYADDWAWYYGALYIAESYLPIPWID